MTISDMRILRKKYIIWTYMIRDIVMQTVGDAIKWPETCIPQPIEILLPDEIVMFTHGYRILSNIAN